MRSERSLCLAPALLAIAILAADAQQINSPEPSATQAQQSPVAASPAPETPPATSSVAEERDDAPAGYSEKLPPGVEPNPPKPEDLKDSGMTWKGEYELDKTGRPVLGPDGRPLPVLYNRKGKRVKSKIKTPKTHPIQIVSGTLTVDGWTGKAQLNYDIPDLKYIYISAPSLGTVIVSQAAFPGSTEQKGAFQNRTVTLTVGNHQLQLTSDKPLLGEKPKSAWVKLDPAYMSDSHWPVMGYGSSVTAPYEWPGAKPQTHDVAADAPPLPVEMRPKLAVPICIAKADRRCSVSESATASNTIPARAAALSVPPPNVTATTSAPVSGQK